MVFSRLKPLTRKFFLAGKGLSFTTGKYFGQAVLVGIFAGFVVVGFRYLIDFGYRWISLGIGLELPMLARVLLPAVGALLGYLLIKRFDSLEHARGTDSAILAFHRRHGYVPPAVLPIKSVASVLTVASGGSAGYEGPVTLLGASCGSTWAGLRSGCRPRS